MDISAATSDQGPAKAEAGMGKDMAGQKARANLLSEHEDFNTHYASLKGWQEAVRKIKPILRAPAQFSLTDIAFSEQAKTTADAVDRLLVRFLSVPIDEQAHAAIIAFLDEQLGISDLVRAKSYLEEPHRSRRRQHAVYDGFPPRVRDHDPVMDEVQRASSAEGRARTFRYLPGMS